MEIINSNMSLLFITYHEVLILDLLQNLDYKRIKIYILRVRDIVPNTVLLVISKQKYLLYMNCKYLLKQLDGCKF